MLNRRSQAVAQLRMLETSPGSKNRSLIAANMVAMSKCDLKLTSMAASQQPMTTLACGRMKKRTKMTLKPRITNARSVRESTTRFSNMLMITMTTTIIQAETCTDSRCKMKEPERKVATRKSLSMRPQELITRMTVILSFMRSIYSLRRVTAPTQTVVTKLQLLARKLSTKG